MKKILALVVAMLLVLGMTSALAAQTVTITNAGADKTYNFYKVFDLTYSADGTKTATSYTKQGETDALLNALQGEGSPFTLTESTVTGTYNVATSADAATIRTWLSNNVSLLGTAIPATEGSASLDDGYYLMTVSHIDSESGEAVTETATTLEVKGADINILDKNQTVPGPDKYETIDSNNYYVGLGTTEDPIPTAEIGKTITYTVTGKFPMYTGEDLIKQVKFVDIMSKGLTFDGVTSVSLTVNGSELTQGTAYTATSSVNEETHATTLTVVLPTVNGDTYLYESDNEYTLTYTATVNEEAILVDEHEVNTVTLKYTTDDDVEHEGGHDTTEVMQYDADIVKVDGEDYLLNGATFKVTKGDTVLKFVAVEGETGVYRLAKTSDEEGAVEELTPNGAKLTIKGLENGSDYAVDEVQVPAGYNRLVSAQSFEINNANLAATITANAWTAGGVKVINQQGTQLPSTGGIGTTIFYVAGGILVLAAVILLVTKRRMKAED